MIGAAFRVMWLSLRRDPAALIMAFVAPTVLFVIFAAIFSGAIGERIRIHLGLADMARTPATERLVAALKADLSLRIERLDDKSVEQIVSRVRSGFVDVALIIRNDLIAPPTSVADGPPASPQIAEQPILLVESPARALATPIALGQLQRALNDALPDVVLSRVVADVERSGKISADERAFLDQVFAEQRARKEPFSFADLVLRQSTETGSGNDRVTYYAGAISAVFLLFAAMHGAFSLIEERRQGLSDRLAAAPGGLPGIVVGKFVFLLFQGVLQAGLIFLAAAGLYGVTIGPRWLEWLATTVLVSAAAAGLALAVCAAAATRQQAHLASTFGVLLLSAIGGSMVPRYLMPPWLQQAGWLTPNAWAIEAYRSALTESWRASLPAWGVLATLALAGLASAVAVVSKSSVTIDQ